MGAYALPSLYGKLWHGLADDDDNDDDDDDDDYDRGDVSPFLAQCLT